MPPPAAVIAVSDRPGQDVGSAPPLPEASAQGAQGALGAGPTPGVAAELLTVMLASSDLDSLLDQIVRLAARAMSASDTSCGLTLAQPPGPHTVATSGDLASQVDEIQYGLGDGPCLQAMRTGEAVFVPDMAAETRWGGYPAHALAYGVRTAYSLPLGSGEEVRGALNLYAPQPEAFSAEDRTAAALFAEQASAALALVSRQARQMELSAQMRAALESRAVIDQAIGIIMAEQRCTARAAFDLLRQASQHRNRKLRDVAADIVRAVSGEDPAPGRFADPA